MIDIYEIRITSQEIKLQKRKVLGTPLASHRSHSLLYACAESVTKCIVVALYFNLTRIVNAFWDDYMINRMKLINFKKNVFRT